MTTKDSHKLVFNRIFVMYPKNNNLSEQDFRDHFDPFGTIRHVHISQENGAPKGIAYLRYDKTSEACKAAEEMHSQTIVTRNMQGKIKVHLATDKKPELELDVEKDCMLLRLFVHYPKNMNEDALRRHFSQFGDVTWLYILKPKDASKVALKGAAFVKFAKQSEAALALEDCQQGVDSEFRVRWADVRRADVNTPHPHGISKEMQEMGGVEGMMPRGMGRGGMGAMADPYGYDERSLMGARARALQMGAVADNWEEESWGGMGGASAAMAQDVSSDPLSIVNSSRGASDRSKTVIEALVPTAMSEEQVRRLFNIPPGLIDLIIDFNTGIVKCQYQSAACASYAKESIDGMELYGETLAVRFPRSLPSAADPASKLETTLRLLQASGGQNVHGLVDQLREVTHALAHGNRGATGSLGQSLGQRLGQGHVPRLSQGMGGIDMTPMGFEPVSNVRLPPIKPQVAIDLPVAQKVFVRNGNRNQPFDDEVFINIMCRFGNLITAFMIPGKPFGFAHYSKKSSAEAAVNTLHNATIEDNTLSVQLSKQDEGAGARGGKRARFD